MQTDILEREQFIPASIEEVFAPFADAANLQAITPPWLHFRIVSSLPEKVQTGARIAYWLRLHGMPIRWTTRIVAWNPPYQFVDVQTGGPFALWCHRHTFESVPGGTIARDRVEYRIGFGMAGRLMHRLLVRRDLDRIFAYRQEAILDLIEMSAATGPGAPTSGQ